jgi:AcrR family transcriptional regulator
MVARAQAAERTAERILDAAVEVFFDAPSTSVSLDEVARRAGVTVQTVIRRFGGRDGLLAAAAERESKKVREERDVPPGDVDGALRVLVGHYERTGDRVLRMLGEEARSATLRGIADQGRRMHRDWCEAVFAPALAGLSSAERARRLAQLVAVCDVYTWMLLRRQAGLSRNQTELALRELVKPLTERSRCIWPGSSPTPRPPAGTSIR